MVCRKNSLCNLFTNSRSRVRAYGNLSLSVINRSGLRQGFSLSLLFNFATEMNTETALHSWVNSGDDIHSDRKLANLEFAINAILLSEYLSKSWAFLAFLNRCLGTFGMGFAPSKCKMLLQDWFDRKPNLFVHDKNSELDRSSYLGICISPGVVYPRKDYLGYRKNNCHPPAGGTCSIGVTSDYWPTVEYVPCSRAGSVMWLGNMANECRCGETFVNKSEFRRKVLGLRS